jgi:20S proteasome alpha/beta subunit
VFGTTIIVALKGRITDESNVIGTIVASDTQVTSNTKESMLKIFQLGQMPILVGGSGSVSFSRHLISKLAPFAQNYQKKLKRNMSCGDFYRLVNLEIEPFLRQEFSSHADVIEDAFF